ncbi:Mor transcription activator family protein [Oceanospirillum beijerinckii]|uniref:Mor transcription activator family protein n=1 Tax=Oceanospirillum beijerinckii TaxID=64976 RepID=UPI000400F605|nr:Mor transcription activator family protein [Oceanospirillum beijerinckii]
MSSSEENTTNSLDDLDPELSAILNNIEAIDRTPNVWPKALADLLSVIQYQLARSLNITLDTAYPYARNSCVAIAHCLGGKQIYLPRSSLLERAFRDIEANQETTCANLEESGLPPQQTLMAVLSIIQGELARSLDITLEAAYPHAKDACKALSNYLSGRAFYLPRSDRLQRALRNIKIYQAFDGFNQRSLAQEYGLTPQRVYSIIEQQRELHHAPPNGAAV